MWQGFLVSSSGKCVGALNFTSHLHDNIPGNDIKFTPVLKVLEINLIAQSVTYIRVTRHSIFQPQRYVGADIT